MWGDQSGAAPEVMVFRRDRDMPTHAHNLPGSVQAMDLSADGKRLAVASKAVHNNVAGGGGRLDLYDLEVGDLRVHGVPRTGQSVRIELEGTPGRPAILLASRSLAKQPSEHPGVGFMVLDRKSAWKVPMGVFDANGVAAVDYDLPSNAAGLTLYFQGGQEAPARALGELAQGHRAALGCPQAALSLRSPGAWLRGFLRSRERVSARASEPDAEWLRPAPTGWMERSETDRSTHPV